MTKPDSTSLEASLRVRLLNRDSAGMVCERLNSDTLRRLHAWYFSPGGLDGGRVLLHAAPVFDTALDRALVIDEAGRIDVQLSAFAFFGTGLILGHMFAGGTRAGVETLEEQEDLLLDVLGRLSQLGPEILLDDETGRLTLGPMAIRTTQSLIALDNSIDLVVQVGVRLVIHGSPGVSRRSFSAPPARLLFLMGILASGVKLGIDDPEQPSESTVEKRVAAVRDLGVASAGPTDDSGVSDGEVET